MVDPSSFPIFTSYSHLGLGTIGFGWKAAQGALKYYDNTEKLVPVLGVNVITILGTQALLTVGYVVSMFVL